MVGEEEPLCTLGAKDQISSKRRAYRKEREGALREFDAKMDDLKRRALEITSAIKEDLGEDVNALGEKRERFVSRLAGLRDASGDAWGELRKGVDDSWDELEHAFADLRKGVHSGILRFKEKRNL